MDTQTLDNKACIKLLKKFSFGGLVSHDFQVTYVPFTLRNDTTIIFHLSKQNQQLKVLENQKALLTVLGPHAFVSSYDYVTSPQVPTWNYFAINVIGKIHLLSEEESNNVIDEMLQVFEPLLLKDKEKLEDSHKEKLLNHICSVKFDIESLEGRAKLGQHKSMIDQKAILDKLELQGKHEFVRLVKEWLTIS